jgi:hypothetical protein
MNRSEEHSQNPPAKPSGQGMIKEDEGIDLRDISGRLGRGLAQIFGLALIGLATAAVIYLVASMRLPVSTSTRVAFSFPGFEKGKYPDESTFQPEDLCAPNIISEALKRQGFENTESFQGKVRAALSIEGLVPPDIIKERDRLRATGQTRAPFIPDEYTLTLTLPRNFPLSNEQQALLLSQIVNVYQENFWRTYADLPQSFGNAFATLHTADFPDYELILNQDIQNIIAYLDQKVEETTTKDQTASQTEAQSRTFRSPTTNLSFGDLLRQTQLFAQIRLNETLGLIYVNGLSQNRATAIAKMEYQLQTLDDQTTKALEEEKMVHDLLTEAQRHAQSYVLGIKSQAEQPSSETPLIDQSLIDSLVANDAYNLLVHQALDAGFKVKELQAERDAASEREKHMESFLQEKSTDQSALMAQVQKSLTELQPTYQELIASIRITNADFARQQFGNAIRLSAPIVTEGNIKPLAIASAIGCFLGLTLGMGLSLLGINIGSSKKN